MRMSKGVGHGFLSTAFAENHRLVHHHKCKEEITVRSLCEKNHLNQVLDELFRMRSPPSIDMYTSLLKACNRTGALRQAKRIQKHLAAHQGESCGSIGNYLVVTLAKCGDIDNAHHIFAGLPYRTVFSWTAIISAYVNHGKPQEALEMYQHMLNECINPDSFTFMALFKACGISRDVTRGKILHDDAYKRGHTSDLYVQNTLVSMYGKSGAFADAEYMFVRLGGRDVVSWNVMLKAYLEHAQSGNALLSYRQMINDGIAPDKHTLVFVLEACSILGQINREPAISKGLAANKLALEVGRAFDADIRRKNISYNDAFVSTALLSMYGKVGEISEAEHIFSALVERDVVVWNALLSVYINESQAIKALMFYAHMQKEDVYGDRLTFLLAFQACGILAEGKEEEILDRSRESTKEMSLRIGKALHDDAGKGLMLNVFSGNALVSMYSKCGAIVEASDAFSSLPERDIVSWNTMLSAFIDHGEGEKAIKLYRQAHEEGILPGQCMFISVIQACCMLCDMENTSVEMALEIGQALHADARRKPFSVDVFLNTTLCSMYGKCGAVYKAEHIINSLEHRDTISWNALFSVYVDHGKGAISLQGYKEMLEEGLIPDQLSFICAFQACCILAEEEEEEEEEDSAEQKKKITKSSCLKIGEALHEDAHRMGYTSDTLVGTALMSMYGKCGSIMELKSSLCHFSLHDLVSWNAMLSVLGNQGQGKRVLDLYREMENQGVLANDITFLCVVHACKETGSLEVCKYIHFYITSTGFDGISALAATLVHAYGCCSSIDDTVVLFDAVCDPDFVSWAAYISGLATAGDILGCKIMFGHLKLVGIAPDKVMFTSILSACSHTGLLLEAVDYFESIRRDHGLDPNSKHYSIMLEAFGRAGDFRRVQNLLENMPMKADLTIWLCLLGACSTHGNLEMAKQVFDRALHMQPLQATAYVMMSNIYAEAELSQCSLSRKN